MTVNNSKKAIEKKIYGLLIEFSETIFLSVQFAYSLEEAFALAKAEFERHNPSKRFGINYQLLGAKIGLFAIKSMNELVSAPKLNKPEISKIERAFDKLGGLPAPDDAMGKSIIEMLSLPVPHQENTIQKVEPVKNVKKSRMEEKNRLMKLIIENKDKNLFEVSKSVFTKSERSYIEERIK